MTRVVTLLIFLTAVGWFFYAIRSRAINVKVVAKILVTAMVDSYIKCKNPSSLNVSDIVKCLKVLFILYCCDLCGIAEFDGLYAIFHYRRTDIRIFTGASCFNYRLVLQ